MKLVGHGTRRVKLGLKRVELWSVVHLSPRFRYRMRLRRRLAERYLQGAGIEIGGLHAPLQVPASVTVRHVDRLRTDELRRHYPELALLRLVDVDIVDDGETLESLDVGSLDFIVANHVIEHCENPLRTLERWLTLLRPGGVIYMAIPDQRATFDRARPLTSFQHVLRDYQEGADWSRLDHLREYARLVEGIAETDVGPVVRRWVASGTRPHYHVWTPASFRETLDRAQGTLGAGFSVDEVYQAPGEFIVVLRRTPSAGTVA